MKKIKHLSEIMAIIKIAVCNPERDSKHVWMCLLFSPKTTLIFIKQVKPFFFFANVVCVTHGLPDVT